MTEEDVQGYPRNFIGQDGLDRYAQGALRVYVYLRDAGQCQYCGVELDWDAAKVDHVIPHRLRGTTTHENLVVACSACNELKGNAEIPEHLRPDTAGDYDNWLSNSDGRISFDAGGRYWSFLVDGADDWSALWDPEDDLCLSDDDLAPYRLEPNQY